LRHTNPIICPFSGAKRSAGFIHSVIFGYAFGQGGMHTNDDRFYLWIGFISFQYQVKPG
jgi:hypothetical protein